MRPQPNDAPVRLHWSSFRPPNVGGDPLRNGRAVGGDTLAQRRRSLVFGGRLTLLLILWGAWQALAPSGSHRALVGTLFFVPADVVATLAALSAAARCAQQPSARTAWGLLACAFAVQLAGVIGQVAYESTGPRRSRRSSTFHISRSTRCCSPGCCRFRRDGWPGWRDCASHWIWRSSR